MGTVSDGDWVRPLFAGGLLRRWARSLWARASFWGRGESLLAVMICDRGVWDIRGFLLRGFAPATPTPRSRRLPLVGAGRYAAPSTSPSLRRSSASFVGSSTPSLRRLRGGRRSRPQLSAVGNRSDLPAAQVTLRRWFTSGWFNLGDGDGSRFQLEANTGTCSPCTRLRAAPPSAS